MQRLPIGDHCFHATTPGRVGASLRPAQAERSSAEGFPSGDCDLLRYDGDETRVSVFCVECYHPESLGKDSCWVKDQNKCMVQNHLKVFTQDGVRKALNTDTGTVYEDLMTLTTNLDDPGRSGKGSVIRLGTLYDFARKHEKHAEDAIRLKGSHLGSVYCGLCSTLTENVDESKGFYLWGVFDRKRYWHSIYLGKAGFGKTANLRNRICEELKDERPFLWRSFLGESQLFRIRDRIHPGRSYTWRRQTKKWGATHIVWYPAEWVEDRAIRAVEADLIEAFDPIANIQRPTPPSKHQRHAANIFEMFRSQIHEARHDKAVLSKFQEAELLAHLARP